MASARSPSLPVLLASLLAGTGCGTALTCREPDISSFTAEGVPDALCDVSFMKCEDGSWVDVSCSNTTFSGEYSCTWMWYGPGPVDLHTGTFVSPDYCVVDVEEMVDQLARGGGPTITIE